MSKALSQDERDLALIAADDLFCRVPDADTQCYALLQAMQRGERLTVAKAMYEYGVYALSQRCGELRVKWGWPIRSTMIELPNGKRVAEYSL